MQNSLWFTRFQYFFGDLHKELPIAKATVSQHLNELENASLIQGEIEAPKVRYCINCQNCKLARSLFADFLKPLKKKCRFEYL